MVDASLPTYYTIVAKLLAEIDLLLANYVFNGYAAVSAYLRIPLGLVTLLYIVIMGYGIVLGQVQVKVTDFAKSVLKIGFIYMAVTQWGWVSSELIGLVNGAISGLGDALIAASPAHIPGVDGIDGAMQIVLIQFSTIGSKVFQTGGLSNLGGYLDGFVIWGFGYFIIALALFEIILSKVLLAILFVFTPLIVLFTYFKPLQGTFDRWLGAIIGAALLQLFVTAVLTLALSICYWWSAAHVAMSALQIGNFGTLPVVIIGIVSIGMVFKAAHLAQNLGGTVSSLSGSTMVAGMVGGAVGSALTSARLASRTLRLGSSTTAGIAKGAVKVGGMVSSLINRRRGGEE